MDENTKLNENTIISILDDFRKPNDNKPRSGKVKPNRKLMTFDSIVFTKWEDLGIEGDPNPKLLELILINSIEELYGNWNQGTDETECKKTARMRDANLLSFGLLDEYYHTEKGANTWLSDRYEEYLKNSDFVKIDYPGEGSYEEIARKDKIKKHGKQPRPLGSLTHFVSDGKKQIASKVLDVIRNKTYKDYLDKDGKVPMFKLPKPCYTLKNFPLPTGQDDNSNSGPLSIEERLDDDVPMIDNGNVEDEQAQELERGHEIEAIEPIHKQKSESNNTQNTPPSTTKQGQETVMGKTGVRPGGGSSTKSNQKDNGTKDFVKKCSVVALLIIVVIIGFAMVFIVIHKQKAISQALEEPKVAPKPSSIKFDNPWEYLPFGKDLNLTVYPRPDNAKLDGIKCKSSEPDIVKIVSESSLHIRAVEESENSEVCDVSIEAYMPYDNNIKDGIIIRVIKNGENEPRGEGRLDHEASGNFSSK